MLDNIPLIPDEEVQKLLPMSEAIELMKKTFVQITKKTITIPQRINLDMPECNADSLIMPVYSSDEKKYGVKIVSLNRDNHLKSLPFIHALLILFDAETGKPISLLDAENLTAIRTGAASGLATQLLSNMDASVAAIFGAGIQAKYQLIGINEVRKISRVLLYDQNNIKAEALKNEMENELDVNIEICTDQEMLKEAQIICTATTSAEPVFLDDHVSTGVHINAIGSYQPDKREIPSETVARSSVYVDSRASCFKEAGDLIIPMKESVEIKVSEIGEILQDVKSGRSSEEEITLFKSVGNAAQDLICAINIYEKFLS